MSLDGLGSISSERGAPKPLPKLVLVKDQISGKYHQSKVKAEKDGVIDDKFNETINSPDNKIHSEINIKASEITEEVTNKYNSELEDTKKNLTDGKLNEKEYKANVTSIFKNLLGDDDYSEQLSTDKKATLEKPEKVTEKMSDDLNSLMNFIDESPKKIPQTPEQLSTDKGTTLEKTKENKEISSEAAKNSVKLSRENSPYFYGILTDEQVIKELKNSKYKNQAAIYHLSSDKKDVVSYLNSKGELKNFPIQDETAKKNLNSHLKKEGKNLLLQTFSPFQADLDQLKENEALVHYQNGYSFILKKTPEGLKQLNLNGSEITDDKNITAVYSSLKDIKKKPYYFGEINKIEAEKILKDMPFLVRREGDSYILQSKDDNSSKSWPLKLSGNLIESSSLLKLEAKGEVARPKRMDLISIKLQSYAKMLTQGSHTVSLSRSFFSHSEGPKEKSLKAKEPIYVESTLINHEDDTNPSSTFEADKEASKSIERKDTLTDESGDISEESIPEIMTPEELQETSRKLVKSFALTSKDHGVMKKDSAEEILKDLPSGKSILWRDPEYAGIMISQKNENNEIKHNKISTYSEYQKAKKDFPFLTSPEVSRQLISETKSMRLLNELKLADKDWGIFKNKELDELLEADPTLLEDEQTAIVWREPNSSGIVITVCLDKKVHHWNVYSKQELDDTIKEQNLDLFYITPPSTQKKEKL